MIELSIKDFQSHKDTNIIFPIGLTCITGENDSGKTSILRALDLILTGFWKPSFVRHGTDKSIVSYKCPNRSIIWEKGSYNKLTFTDRNETQVITKFGKEIPQPIKSITGSYPIILGDGTEIYPHIARNRDPSIFVNKSPVSKNRIINALASINLADYVIKSLTSLLQKSQHRQSEIEKNIEKIKLDLAEYDDLPQQKTLILHLKDKLEKIKLLLEKIKKLSEISNKYREVSEKNKYTIKDYEQVSGLIKKLEQVLSLKNNIQSLSKLKENLISNLKIRNEIRNKKLTIEEEIRKTKINIKEILKRIGICPTCGQKLL